MVSAMRIATLCATCFLQLHQADGDAQVGHARLLAGVQHGGHLLELALGVAAHQHAQAAGAALAAASRRSSSSSVTGVWSRLIVPSR